MPPGGSDGKHERLFLFLVVARVRRVAFGEPTQLPLVLFIVPVQSGILPEERHPLGRMHCLAPHAFQAQTQLPFITLTPCEYFASCSEREKVVIAKRNLKDVLALQFVKRVREVFVAPSGADRATCDVKRQTGEIDARRCRGGIGGYGVEAGRDVRDGRGGEEGQLWVSRCPMSLIRIILQ